jgi:antirestriction protein ArdC
LKQVHATYVRSFKSWIDAGRCVRKGETSIRIFAPRPWQRETAVDEAGTLQIEQGVSFAAVPVFDVSQTDPIPGHPHPWQPPARRAASGDESLAWTIWKAMLAHAGALHLIVTTSESDPLARSASYGCYLHDAAAIWVRPDRARADMAATLAHELAHTVTHDAAAAMTRDVREVVAESVAYAVCSRFGLDLSLRAVDDVAGWGHPQGHDPDSCRVGMAAIHDGAAALIDAIQAAMTDAGEIELAA